MNKIIKKSGEIFFIASDWENREPVISGATLSSGTVTAKNLETDEVVTTDLTSNTVTISSYIAKTKILAYGASGQNFLVSQTITFSDTTKLIEDFYISIRD